MSNEQTVADLKATAGAIDAEDLRRRLDEAYWDQAMDNWFVAHKQDFETALRDVARMVVRNDGAVSLLALYVAILDVERSTEKCPAARLIQNALGRLAEDLSSRVPPP